MTNWLTVPFLICVSTHTSLIGLFLAFTAFSRLFSSLLNLLLWTLLFKIKSTRCSRVMFNGLTAMSSECLRNAVELVEICTFSDIPANILASETVTEARYAFLR